MAKKGMNCTQHKSAVNQLIVGCVLRHPHDVLESLCIASDSTAIIALHQLFSGVQVCCIQTHSGSSKTQAVKMGA